MYNPQLNAFTIVAENGSFNKAAEALYISPTAVMKQINALENHLGVKLFERTSQGVHLTAGGQMLYRDAKFMMEYSARAIENAKAAMQTEAPVFRVGTSLLNPAKPFMDLWYSVSADFSDYSLRLVPFEDDHEGILSVIGQLGKKFDFLIGVCDSRKWLDKCRMLPLGTYKKMCAVSRKHRLAHKKVLNYEDLYGQTLMMVPQGDSGTNDFIRNDLTKNHPQIKIEDTPQYYDISVFNRCAETGNVLLTIECWQDVHPALVNIPLNWGYEIPYGLLYALEPSEAVQHFVDVLSKKVQ